MNMKLRYLCLLLVGLVLCMNYETAYAGEINAAEQQVINAACGTFTYNGATYKAYDEYVAELRSYFLRDDVNLDQSEVAGLINDMNNSVGDGVKSGYLYKIGGNENKDDQNNASDKEEWEEIDIDPKSPKKNFDIEKSLEHNKIFYTDDATNESVEVNLVIKNTGYDVSRLIYVAVGLLLLMVCTLFLCVRYDLFAPTEES